jgi:serine/threonine-protein kinase
MARQVSHPNVCRVHDVGEFAGEHFISMEYVDGEDLASLLRRVDHFPSGRAVQVTHQLCMGLAAMHFRGVLSRDLKPSNILIDTTGQVRIADFGLAVLAADRRSGEIAGTPAYMAPEQFSGTTSVQSDLYSLGLVLYELFVGRRAFDGHAFKELERMHRSEPVPSPSGVLPEIDPAVERAILSCLEKDPRRRPRSSLELARAMPGGPARALRSQDFLAAIGGGSTPSPRQVAALPADAPRPADLAALALLALAGLVAAVALSERAVLVSRVPLPKPPDALEDHAHTLLRKLGHEVPGGDDARGFLKDRGYLAALARLPPAERDVALASGWPALRFWYRQAAAKLDPKLLIGGVNSVGVVPRLLARNGAIPMSPGSALVELDTRGRLLRLEAVPPQEPSGGKADWRPLFDAAELDVAAFRPAPPSRVLPLGGDDRQAWVGRYPLAPWPEVRVEAAAYRGRPIYFQVLAPWSSLEAETPEPLTARERASFTLFLAVFIVAFAGSIPIAWRNVRQGRGDRHGAYLVAAAAFALTLLGWILATHHVTSLEELSFFFPVALSWALFGAASMWVLYLALEPLARRQWPGALISWSRVLGGQPLDPLVARDVLIGCVIGCLALVRLEIPALGSGGPLGLFVMSPAYGLKPSLSLVSSLTMVAMFDVLGFLFLLLVLRAATRRDLLAGVVFVVLFSSIDALRFENPALPALLTVPLWGMFAWCLVRVGLLAAVVGRLLGLVLAYFPITPHLAAWYGTGTLVVVVLYATLCLGAVASGSGLFIGGPDARPG